WLETELAGSIPHQLRLLLSAGAIHPRIVRAGGDRIDPGAGGGGPLGQSLIDPLHPPERETGPSPTRLVGDHDDGVSRLAQYPQAFHRTGQETQLGGIVEVMPVDHHSTVPIEDDRPSSARGCHDLAAAATRRMVSVVLCAGTRSASRTLPPR